MANLSKFHLAAVIWEDANHSLEEYTPEEVARDFHKPARETNYGLLIKDDAVGVTLACEEGADGNFRHTFFIPRAMIKDVVDLGIPRTKPPRKSKEPAP